MRCCKFSSSLLVDQRKNTRVPAANTLLGHQIDTRLLRYELFPQTLSSCVIWQQITTFNAHPFHTFLFPSTLCSALSRSFPQLTLSKMIRYSLHPRQSHHQQPPNAENAGSQIEEKINAQKRLAWDDLLGCVWPRNGCHANTWQLRVNTLAGIVCT